MCRPQKYIGEKAVWDEAERQLAAALNNNGREWKENPEDGAFYGPKIDINVFDALGRKHQCATIQLDFQLPIRFGLKYNAAAGSDAGEDKEERPIIIHRAILGSVERFTAILIEHLAGKWPFWLSPRQVAIVPVGADQFAYGAEVQAVLRNEVCATPPPALHLRVSPCCQPLEAQMQARARRRGSGSRAALCSCSAA